jgi:hypothetical protein
VKPSETPYLHVQQTEGSLFPYAVEVTGNAKALLQLRQQIDRALKDQAYPLDDATYRDVYEEEYEVVVKRARSREEMRPRGRRLLGRGSLSRGRRGRGGRGSKLRRRGAAGAP